MPVRIRAGEVKEVDATEDDEETAEKGDSVDRVGGVEALEKDERGTESGSCESYVIEWCHSVLNY